MLNAGTLLSRHQRTTRLSAAALFVLIVLFSQWGLFSWLDLLFYDLHFKIRGSTATSGQVVLVYMDEESAVRLGRHQAFWSRQHLAQAITHLSTAGSEIIALDMVLSAPAQNPDQDRQLAASIAHANNVVLARISSVAGLGSLEPLALFRHGMIGDGFIDLPLDRDDCLRKVRFINVSPLADGSLQLLPAFAMEVARVYRNLDYVFDFSHPDFFTLGAPEQQQLHLPYPELLINYAGDDRAFVQLSYADIVENRFDPRQVAGKIVLIGSSLKTEKDLFNTPFSRYRALESPLADRFAQSVSAVQNAKEPGLACHAHAIETILSGNFITALPRHGDWLVWAAFSLCGYPIFFRQSRGSRLLISAVALSIIILGGCQLAFENGLWIRAVPLLALTFAQLLAGFLSLKIYQQHRSDWVTAMFGKYVSESIVDRLVQGQITPSMEGQRQNLTILFADLRGFTTLAEKLTAQQTTQLLNCYFAAMIPQIQSRQGTVDKLIGDAIMAFFGAPMAYPDHAQQAALTALHLVKTLEELKKNTALPGLHALEMGIGLNSGEVTIGNLGCDAFMNYTVMGDNVNLASRLEGLNKIYGTRILLSEQSAGQLDDSLCLRELDQVIVKGRDRVTTLYELVGLNSELSDADRQQLHHFAGGLAHYRHQQWAAAHSCFAEVLALNPADGPSRLYLQRIATLQETAPDKHWDAITRFQHK